MNNKNISKKQAGKVLAERDPYVGIVLEDINDKLKTVLDGQAMSDQRIDRLHGTVSRLEVKVEHLDMRVSSVEMGVSRLESKVGSLESEVDKLKSEIRVGFEKIGNQQESNEAKIKILEHRTTNLEKSAT